MLIDKITTPKLWELITKMTWSGCGSVSPKAVCVSLETEFSAEDIKTMELNIIDAWELVGSEGMAAFGSGDMLMEMDEDTYHKWIVNHKLNNVNRLLNEIYLAGAFKEG